MQCIMHCTDTLVDAHSQLQSYSSACKAATGLAILKSPSHQAPAHIGKYKDPSKSEGWLSCLLLAEAEEQLEDDDHEEPACCAWIVGLLALNQSRAPAFERVPLENRGEQAPR